jgi:aspartate aminotransferase-like enzyme
MIPPGLAMLAVSEAAWKQMERVEPQAFYFDLQIHRAKLRAKQAGAGPDTPWTPAHTLIAGLAESLQLIRDKGIETVWARSARLSKASIAGVRALGLELFARSPAAGMTAVKIPPGIDGRSFLERVESRFGVKLAGGQGPLEGRIFRLAHFGVLDALDIIAALVAIELVLDQMGYEVTLGAAVAAAGRVLQEEIATPAMVPSV